MTEYVPYFALFISVLFGIAFFAALQGFKKSYREDREDSNPKSGKDA